MKNVILTKLYKAPCGVLTLGSVDGMLCLCDWPAERRRSLVQRRLETVLVAAFADGTSEVIKQAALELDEYFAGRRRTFDVPLLFAGTDFQKTVWTELLNIPYGQTASYAEIARRIGRPEAVRAVANAVGANALSVFVPCHRVVGSDRSLTGYAGGLEAKSALLNLEFNNTTPSTL